MEEIQGRVAVITGAASGIGKGIAQAFSSAGMKLVLADIESNPLKDLEEDLKAQGTEVVGVSVDVSKADQVEALAEKTREAFGAVHILCNNAGVASGSPLGIWHNSLEEWHWVMGVNLMGVVHGIRSFVPIMLRQGQEAHIVNTASFAGLTTTPSNGIYAASKHAVMAISETLFHELQMRKSKVSVSVLCPGWVNTNIHMSERNWPEEYEKGRAEIPAEMAPFAESVFQYVQDSIMNGLSPRLVGEQVLEAIRANRFYILTHPHWNDLIRNRMECILSQQAPELMLPPDQDTLSDYCQFKDDEVMEPADSEPNEPIKRNSIPPSRF